MRWQSALRLESSWQESECKNKTYIVLRKSRISRTIGVESALLH
jgi:hypothetical protein